MNATLLQNMEKDEALFLACGAQITREIHKSCQQELFTKHLSKWNNFLFWCLLVPQSKQQKPGVCPLDLLIPSFTLWKSVLSRSKPHSNLQLPCV